MPSASQPPALDIAVGIIIRDGRILVARRAEGQHLGGLWEFPGGKRRPGEAIEETLRREVEEETGLRFRGAVLLHCESHAYPERTVELHFFLCLDLDIDLDLDLVNGTSNEAIGREGQEVRWVTLAELGELEMPAGNRTILKILAEQLGEEAA